MLTRDKNDLHTNTPTLFTYNKIHYVVDDDDDNDDTTKFQLDRVYCLILAS